MRFRIAAAILGAIALASIAYSEYRKADVQVSSAPVAYLVADSEQELTRLPLLATRLSDQEEVAIGDAIAKNYDRSFAESHKNGADYKTAQEYVSHVGNQMVGYTRRKLPYKFHYIPDPYFVNAFALPGGHVFIGQGLISLMDSEDELASVLGHEMEHADLGHCAERVQIQARLKGLHLDDLADLVNIPYQVFAAGYTKEQELEADANGTQLAVDAHYSPMGAVRLFQAFSKYEPDQRRAGTPQEELASVTVSSLTEYFRSHPRSSDRARAVESLMAANHWPTPPERELAIAYIALNEEASAALAKYEYARAIAFARRSLKARPDQPHTRMIYYDAAMYTGDFADAASMAESLLQDGPSAEVGEVDLAQALAAQRKGNTAVDRFHSAVAQFAASIPARNRQLVEIDEAGLRLLAGDETWIRRELESIKARAISGAADYNPPNATAEQMVRVGHWYFLAAQYPAAYDVINEALQVAPANPEQRTALGWAALQDGKLSVASSNFLHSSIADDYSSAPGSPESVAGLAVLSWRLEKRDDAVAQWNRISPDPRWSNAGWVKAMYGPSAFDTLQQVQAEADRRRRQKPR